MTDEGLTRPRTVTASPRQTFMADRFSIGLAVVGFALAGALAAVLLLPDRESSAAPAPTTEETSTTTASTAVFPPSTAPASATSAAPFLMPPSREGTWVAVDGSATATFSASDLIDLDAVLSGDDGNSIRYRLTRPSAIGPTLEPTAPAGMVLEGSVELNGVQRPIRAVASLVPTAAGLRLSFPLGIDPSLYDMSGPETTAAIELILLPG